MITNFNIFENNNEQTRVNDYVYVNIDNALNISNFINNNVGRILRIPKGYKNYFNVEWENAPYNGNALCNQLQIRYVDRNEIKYYSKNKEDVETYIASLKYGL